MYSLKYTLGNWRFGVGGVVDDSLFSSESGFWVFLVLNLGAPSLCQSYLIADNLCIAL